MKKIYDPQLSSPREQLAKQHEKQGAIHFAKFVRLGYADKWIQDEVNEAARRIH